MHRDFDVWIDPAARRAAGLDVPFIDAEIGPGTDRAREPYYSLVYDRFVGHEFFDYLLAAVERFLAIDRDAIRSRVADKFHHAFPDADRRFAPRTMFYFADTPQPDEQHALVDLHQAPEWR